MGLYPATSGGLENPFFNGGFIVGTYGLTNATAPVDAVQIEFGSVYRQTDTFDQTAEATAAAIAGHLRAHCPDVVQ